jgi:hypothetical protein
MKPGDLRRFRDSLFALGADHVEGSTFMVLRVTERTEGETWRWFVDILLDGMQEEGLGYNWVMDSSEVISEAG